MARLCPGHDSDPIPWEQWEALWQRLEALRVRYHALARDPAPCSPEKSWAVTQAGLALHRAERQMKPRPRRPGFSYPWACQAVDLAEQAVDLAEITPRGEPSRLDVRAWIAREKDR